ncbi:MAG: hypothetical protein ABI760_25035 [Ferruginibacter sp.]
MKKLFVAILAVLYMSASIGATVQKHYCMGKLADWGLGHSESKACNKCGMEKSVKNGNGCCKDEHKFIKNVTDQKTTEVSQLELYKLAVSLPVSFFEFSTCDFPSVTEENPISHAPPQKNGVAVYIRNCVFRI